MTNIKQTAIRVLQTEAQALLQLTDRVGPAFETCVHTILHTPGRVVVSGIGKSAIIAQKIVATLNSTGTPALFMHAADAIHGDLGMIQRDDVVICISKSGSTPEIKVLVPLLKRTGAKLIALVGNLNSWLADQADCILDATVAQEACPHDLAPTTSTTAALALGDALAICLLEARSFGREDFARLHPGGTLGKRLYLTVDDLSRLNELPQVSLQADLHTVILEMTSKRLGATAVVDDDGALAGIITDGDLRRMLRAGRDLAQVRATDIMTPRPKTIETGTYAVTALEMMQLHQITQLIVLEGTRPVGFVHMHDLLREGLV